MLRKGRTISFLPLLGVLAVGLLAGCGGSSGDSGDASAASGAAPASVAAPGSVVFVEGNLRPTGELESNTNSVAKKIGDVDDLGEFIVSELEISARQEGRPVNFATEVEPWLGKVAGIAFSRLEGGELSEPLVAVQTTDTRGTTSFVDKQTGASEKPFKAGSYKGIDFKVGGSEGNAIGVVGEWLVIADGEKEFEAAVDAYKGESLADESRFQDAISNASAGSLADVYIDVGTLSEQSKGSAGSETQDFLEAAGVDPDEATAVASVIPAADQIEVDLSSNLGDEQEQGDVSKLLGSLPASSTAAFAVSNFGEQLEEAIDNLDEEGVPPNLPPDELKKLLSETGVDIDKVAASLEEAAVFVEGSNRANLGGALVAVGNSSEAAETVASLGVLLRSAKVPGITVVSGKANGFSVPSAGAGSKPIVVVGKGDRVAVGYGLPDALAGLNAGSGATLSGSADYKAAVASLGKTPISAYANGPAAVEFAEVLVPASAKEFWKAAPYLKKITHLALGKEADGEPGTAKLIASLK